MNDQHYSDQAQAIALDAASADINRLFNIFKELRALRIRSAVRSVDIDESSDQRLFVEFEISNIYRPFVLGQKPQRPGP